MERAREIMDAFPDRGRNENLKFMIAEAYELSGDIERALDAYRDFLEEYPLVDEDGNKSGRIMKGGGNPALQGIRQAPSAGP